MRYVYSFCIALLSMTATAGHLLGGEITWECLGNQQYLFKLNLYRECGGSTALPSSYILQTSHAVGSIPVNRVAIIDLTMDCAGPSSGGCGNSQLYGRTELNRYEGVVTLPGSPPPTGWKFSFNMCCGPNGVNLANPNSLVSLESTMYPSPSNSCNSSPIVPETPIHQITPINRSFSVKALRASDSDSLYYEFDNFPSASTFYASGYGYNRPFPNNNSHPQNGPVNILHNTGLIRINAVTGVSGFYHYAVRIEQWRDYHLISEIKRSSFAYAQFDSTSNSVPAAFIDTAAYPGIDRQGATYTIEAHVEDTLFFEIVSEDLDSNTAMNRFQEITFNALGDALETYWGSNNNYSSKATISPIYPQIGFTNQLSNKVIFYWPIENEHFSDNPTHDFTFIYSDDQCPYVGVKYLRLFVQVKPAQQVGLNEVARTEWQVYPNPTTDNFYVSGLSEAQQLELLDVSGRRVRLYDLQQRERRLDINTAGLPPGLYFIKVHFGNTTSVKKVLFK